MCIILLHIKIFLFKFQNEIEEVKKDTENQLVPYHFKHYYLGRTWAYIFLTGNEKFQLTYEGRNIKIIPDIFLASIKS